MIEWTIFPDTNVFLQCRSLHELPWEELGQFDKLTVLIADQVTREIDDLKSNGNSRRAQRARGTNSLFRKMLDDPNKCVSFVRRGKQVEVRFAPGLPVGWQPPQALDRQRPDDCLLEEALAYLQSHHSTMLLSADTGAEVKSERLKLPFIRVPDDWRLAPESDERDKELAALRLEITSLKSREPEISISCLDLAGTCERISAKVPLYAPLSRDELATLKTQLRSRHPPATRIDDPALPKAINELERSMRAFAGFDLIGVSEEDKQKYEKDYANWETTTLKQLDRLPALLNIKHRWKQFHIHVQNEGTASADHLLLEITLFGGVRLCIATEGADDPHPYALSQSVSDAPEIPTPPETPRPMTGMEKALRGMTNHDIDSNFFLPNRDSYLSNLVDSATANTDRYALRIREEEDEMLSSWSIECEEFRHRRGGRKIMCWLAIPIDTPTSKACLRVRATARNISAPIDCTYPIEVVNESSSAFELAKNWRSKSPRKGVVGEDKGKN